MKRKLLIVSVVAICIAILAAGSLAYFTAEGKAHNVITTGGVEIALQEWADEAKTIPYSTQEAKGVMPGTTVTKIVQVKNTGASDAWVRVKVEKNIELGQGIEIPGVDNPQEELVALDINTQDWQKDTDGFYRYKSVLKPGETTTPILRSVEFKPAMDNVYQNAQISVDISAQAVQYANNGTTVVAAQGWPTT